MQPAWNADDVQIINACYNKFFSKIYMCCIKLTYMYCINAIFGQPLFRTQFVFASV